MGPNFDIIRWNLYGEIEWFMKDLILFSDQTYGEKEKKTLLINFFFQEKFYIFKNLIIKIIFQSLWFVWGVLLNSGVSESKQAFKNN